MRCQAHGFEADLFTFQVPNGADTFMPKQFEAADVHTGYDR